MSFSTFGLSPALVLNLQSAPLNFTQMTQVQQKTLPVLLSRTDLHVQAKTGEGKTVAFLVPAIQHCLQNPLKKGIKVLVVSPTRELALQIAAEAKTITANMKINIGVAIGGTNINKEVSALPSLDILVATPGRLLDHLGNVNIQTLVYNLDMFVLDECDRLLDMGFTPDILKIIKHLPAKENRQSVLCSATNTPRVAQVAKQILRDGYGFVSTIVAGDVNTHELISQECVITPFNNHLQTVLVILDNEPLVDAKCDLKAIVFLPTAHLANLYYLAYTATHSDCSGVFVQHSRQSQSKREKTSTSFRDASKAIMFATDVVARGMDFPNVSLVVQVGVPDAKETYIHRIGRTGRAGKTGKSYIVLDEMENFVLYMLRPLPVRTIPVPKALRQTHCDVNAQISKRGVISDEAKAQVYQSWLGYYKGHVKPMKISLGELVHVANVFAQEVMGCDDAPEIEARVVGKMGLKGVPGLRIVSGKKGGNVGGGRGGRESVGGVGRSSESVDSYGHASSRVSQDGLGDSSASVRGASGARGRGARGRGGARGGRGRGGRGRGGV